MYILRAQSYFAEYFTHDKAGDKIVMYLEIVK